MSESRWGASQVEVYDCTSCHAKTRFPRYNHPLKLLETRKGRCGEWANVFTLFCTSLGYETRYILDLTDHVWTEIYSEHQQRWIHLDACEAAFDQPLLYESGWGKSLNFVIGLSANEIIDVTPRYTRRLDQVMEKRKVHERSFAATLKRLTASLRTNLSESLQEEYREREAKEEAELIQWSKEERDVKQEEFNQRQSGGLAWRRARGEHL
jgi:peptide-N4-(N-acetyl-beta-glucosaminyl)asparagine amidase